MKVEESEPKSQRTLCRLLGYTRQAYYKQRRRGERRALESELILQQVVRVRERQKRIGARKLHHMLSGFLCEHRIGMGRDALLDLLREHSLLVRRRRTRRPRTTVSALWMKRYPNLAKDLVPHSSNQLWVSDITYVRVASGFGYLSLVTDAYSRKIVGYHLARDLRARGCVAALRMALSANPERDSLVHHSDRGLQYYCSTYTALLGSSRARISMTEKSDPLENAIAERVNGILKHELLKRRFQTFAEAREDIDRAVSIYNNLRPHLSIDMLTPSEAHQRTGELKRRWKNYFSKPIVSQAMA